MARDHKKDFITSTLKSAIAGNGSQERFRIIDNKECNCWQGITGKISSYRHERLQLMTRHHNKNLVISALKSEIVDKRSQERFSLKE